MYHYEYVPKRSAAPYRREIEEIIKAVQNEVRDYFTFQPRFIGSSSRNMITYDPMTNIGFDFDVNIEVNDDDEEYTPEELRTILREAFTRVSRHYGFQKCEDSTRVLTIKKIDYEHSSVFYSCDIAIVFFGEEGQRYIRFNKETQRYTRELQQLSDSCLEERADELRTNGLWNEVRDIYLFKKNNNTNPDKHSRSLYAEAVNECYRSYNKT